MRHKIPYGYEIKDGKLTILPHEAAGVKKMFELYLTGMTQKDIAAALDADGFIYCADSPAWSKAGVGNVLKNPCYIGENNYPIIISRKTFQSVQEMRAGRAKQRKAHPALCLAKKIRCGQCGNDFRRISEWQWRDSLHFRCDHCRAKATITDADLLAEIERQAAEYTPPSDTSYEPTGEVVRLTNAINRGLEHPEQSEDMVALIMQGITARYDCFTTRMTATELLRLIKGKAYDQAVEYIAIRPDNSVTVTFKSQT